MRRAHPSKHPCLRHINGVIESFRRISRLRVVARAIVSYPTIGAGSRKMPDGSPVTMASRAISQAEAEAMFNRQAISYRPVLAAAVPQVLGTGEAAALMSLVHNCGPGVVQGLIIQKAIVAGEDGRGGPTVRRLVCGPEPRHRPTRTEPGAGKRMMPARPRTRPQSASQPASPTPRKPLATTSTRRSSTSFSRRPDTVDWTPVEQAAISAAALIISASAAVAAAYIRSHVKGQATAAVEMKAVTVGAGIAAASLQAAVAKGAPDWTAARDTALAEGTAATRDVMETVTPVQIASPVAPRTDPDLEPYRREGSGQWRLRRS